MRVCFAGARRLGLDCLAWLTGHADVVAAWVPESGWWDDCDDRAELAALGVDLVHPQRFRDLEPDLVVSVLADYIFKPADLAVYDAVNLHPAPLPAYRGCNSYAHAIMDGDSHYGIALHYVDEGVDTGPLAGWWWFPIWETDTGGELYRRAHAIAADMFRAWMPGLLAIHETGRRASTREQGPGRYYRRDSLADKRTHPDDEARIRALTFPPHPPPVITTSVPVGFGRNGVNG